MRAAELTEPTEYRPFSILHCYAEPGSEGYFNAGDHHCI